MKDTNRTTITIDKSVLEQLHKLRKSNNERSLLATLIRLIEAYQENRYLKQKLEALEDAVTQYYHNQTTILHVV